LARPTPHPEFVAQMGVISVGEETIGSVPCRSQQKYLQNHDDVRLNPWAGLTGKKAKTLSCLLMTAMPTRLWPEFGLQDERSVQTVAYAVGFQSFLTSNHHGQDES
jgi:hypothetical protein